MYHNVGRNWTSSAAAHAAAAVQFLLKSNSETWGAFHDKVGRATAEEAEEVVIGATVVDKLVVGVGGVLVVVVSKLIFVAVLTNEQGR